MDSTTPDRQRYVDKYIVCIDCGGGFLFEAGEQFFFQSKGLAEPKRCRECRATRKASIIPAHKLAGAGEW
jgi:hypothetical protein